MSLAKRVGGWLGMSVCILLLIGITPLALMTALAVLIAALWIGLLPGILLCHFGLDGCFGLGQHLLPGVTA